MRPSGRLWFKQSFVGSFFLQNSSARGTAPFPHSPDAFREALPDEPAADEKVPLGELASNSLFKALVQTGEDGAEYLLSLAAAPQIVSEWSVTGTRPPEGMEEMARYLMKATYGTAFAGTSEEAGTMTFTPAGKSEPEITIRKTGRAGASSERSRWRLTIEEGTVRSNYLEHTRELVETVGGARRRHEPVGRELPNDYPEVYTSVPHGNTLEERQLGLSRAAVGNVRSGDVCLGKEVGSEDFSGSLPLFSCQHLEVHR